MHWHVSVFKDVCYDHTEQVHVSYLLEEKIHLKNGNLS
jgi:hypothetical protein